MIEESSTVVSTMDLPQHRLRAGDLETVVMAHRDGKGYPAESTTLGGDTITVATLPAHQVRSTRSDDIAHGRELAPHPEPRINPLTPAAAGWYTTLTHAGIGVAT